MTKQELAAICIARLKAEYPDSDCTLDYDHVPQYPQDPQQPVLLLGKNPMPA